MQPVAIRSPLTAALGAATIIGLMIAGAAGLTGAFGNTETQEINQPIRSIAANHLAPRHQVFYVRPNPGAEVLATDAPWMPFLRQGQIIRWNDDRTELTFKLDGLARHIERIMPQIEETGFLMLDVESGPRAKEVGILDEWIEGVNEAIRIAIELCPPGTIVGSYPGPSHVRRFREESFGAMNNSTGLFFPIHKMDGNRLERFAERIAESPYHDLPVVVFTWQFINRPEHVEQSLWSDQGGGEWVSEQMFSQRVRDALDLFEDAQIAVRGRGPDAARAIQIAQGLVDAE